MNIDYVVISDDGNPLYQDFDRVTSDMWNFFGINVITVKIGEKFSIVEENGNKIITLKVIDHIPTSLQAQIARYYITQKFPDEGILISDLDMLPLNIEYFTLNAEKLDRGILLYTVDHLGDINNTIKFYKGFDPNVRNAACYTLAKGGTYKELLEIEDEFEDYVSRLYKLNLGWNTDEIYLGNQVCKHLKNHTIEVVSMFRGTMEKYSCSRNRLDREYLHLYSNKKIVSKYFYDFHCPRPFAEHKEFINRVINLTKKTYNEN